MPSLLLGEAAVSVADRVVASSSQRRDLASADSRNLAAGVADRFSPLSAQPVQIENIDVALARRIVRMAVTARRLRFKHHFVVKEGHGVGGVVNASSILLICASYVDFLSRKGDWICRKMRLGSASERTNKFAGCVMVSLPVL